jgi:hypothetical protein
VHADCIPHQVSAKSAKEKEKLAEAKEKQKAVQAEAKQLMEKLATSEGKVTALSAELETKKKAEERVSAERRAAEAEVEKVSGKAMSLEAKVAAAREAAARAAEEAGVRVAEMEARLAENDKRTKAAIADQAAARLEAQQAVCCGSGRGHHDCLGWPLVTSDCVPHQATALEEGTRRSQEVVTRAEKRASVAEAAEHATRIEVKMHQVQCRQCRDGACEGRGGCMHVLITAPLTLFPTGTRRQSRGGACEGRGGAADFSTSRLPRRAPTCPRGFRAEGRRCAGGGGGGDGGGGGG